MSANPALLPGDHLPGIALPDAAGAVRDLSHQSLAGRPRLLVLGRPPSAETLAGAAAALSARGAVLVLVSGSAPDGAAAAEGAPLRLFDPDRRLFAALGLPEGGVAVMTERERLGPVVPGPPEAALPAALDALPPPARPETRRGGAPVLLLPDLLEPDLVRALLDHWERGEKTRDAVASGRGAAGADRIKRRADVPLDDRALYAAFQRRVERRAAPELWRAFRFRAASFEAPRVGCYDSAEGGAFGAHRDNRTPYTAHRRFAMSLNLNAGAYEGGAIRFPEFGPELYEPPTGGACLFCCDLLHEAMPVTAGRRFAVFTFLTDAEGARAEQALIRQSLAEGRTGVALR